MRKILIISFCFFVLFVYGLVLSQGRVTIIEEELAPKNPSGFYDYRGETNIHTNLNLGSAPINEVITAAQESNLDFLFVTDLNIFNRNLAIEGYHRKLLVMVGAEYSYLDSRILLYDTIDRQSFESPGQAQVLLADLLSEADHDGKADLLVLAHPFKLGYSWSGTYPPGLNGIEVINLKSLWQRGWMRSKLSFFWSAFIYPFNSQLALLRLYDEPMEELGLWDQINAERPLHGFAGVEASAKTASMGDFYFRFPSYQTSFNFLSNHVLLKSELTGELETDRKKIMEALLHGQFYMSLDILGNPKGFSASVGDRERSHPIGSHVKYYSGLKMHVHLPQVPTVPFETAILKDGVHLTSYNSQDTDYEIPGPGVYRAVVRVFSKLTLPDGQRWISWIYTNPFYIE